MVCARSQTRGGGHVGWLVNVPATQRNRFHIPITGLKYTGRCVCESLCVCVRESYRCVAGGAPRRRREGAGRGVTQPGRGGGKFAPSYAHVTRHAHIVGFFPPRFRIVQFATQVLLFLWVLGGAGGRKRAGGVLSPKLNTAWRRRGSTGGLPPSLPSSALLSLRQASGALPALCGVWSYSLIIRFLFGRSVLRGKKMRVVL